MLAFFCTWSRREVLILLIFLQVTIILSLHGLTVGSGIQEQMQVMLLLVIEAGKAIGMCNDFWVVYCSDCNFSTMVVFGRGVWLMLK